MPPDGIPLRGSPECTASVDGCTSWHSEKIFENECYHLPVIFFLIGMPSMSSLNFTGYLVDIMFFVTHPMIYQVCICLEVFSLCKMARSWHC